MLPGYFEIRKHGVWNDGIKKFKWNPWFQNEQKLQLKKVLLNIIKIIIIHNI